MWKTYNESDRDRGLQGIGQFGGIGTDAAFSGPNGVDGLADTFLSSVPMPMPMLGRCSGDMAVTPDNMMVFPCLPLVVSCSRTTGARV